MDLLIPTTRTSGPRLLSRLWASDVESDRFLENRLAENKYSDPYGWYTLTDSKEDENYLTADVYIIRRKAEKFNLAVRSKKYCFPPASFRTFVWWDILSRLSGQIKSQKCAGRDRYFLESI